MHPLSKTLLIEWVPSHLRWLIRPALLGSIGLHVLLLLAPISQQSDSQPSLPAQEQVRVSRLPQPRPAPSPLAQPAAKAAPKPSPTAVPKLAVVPKLTVAPKVQQVLPRPTLPQPLRPAVAPASPQAAAPAPTSTPVPSPSPTPVPPPEIPFADIPVLAGAQTGCFGLGTCHQISDGTNFRAAGQTLKQTLQAQGYTVKLRDDIEEAGREVYEISKDNQTRYLNVLSSDLGTAVYLVTTEPVDLTKLQSSETDKAELEGLLDRLPGVTSAAATQLAQPEAFFAGTTPRPEADKLRLVPNNSTEQLLSTLSSQLQSQSFDLTQAGGYGNGMLYEVTKGAYTGYLSLVPTTDQTGTIVVLWSNLPS